MSDKVQKIKEAIIAYKGSIEGIEECFDIGKCKIEALNHILELIDSLPEENHFEDKSEMVSEDLEEEITKCYKSRNDLMMTRNQFGELIHRFTEWQRKKDQETIELAEDHAMLAGMNKMKEEMMKDAVECTWGSQATSSFMSDFPNIECGDRAKIIIVKED